MKKVILALAIAMLPGSILFTGCKKDTSQITTIDNAVQTQNLSRAVASGEEQQTGIVSLSEDLFKATQEGELLSGERTGDHTYKAIATLPHDGGPYTDPCAQDWADFNAWYAAHYPAWQALANATCQRVGFAWSGKRCLACVIGFVLPDPRKCPGIAVYNPTERVFE